MSVDRGRDEVAQDAAVRDARLGMVLDGRYRIDAQIGSGGHGLVYRGEQIRTGQPIAIKLLRLEDACKPKRVQQLLHEAKVLGRISHPNAISVLDVGEVDGAPYLIMEFLVGRTLNVALESLGGNPRPLDQAVSIVRQILGAVAAAHAHGIVHRDLKPYNVMLLDLPEESTFVKVLDFGIASWAGHSQETPQGKPFGTLCYRSPEQIRGEEGDARADVYSAGAILYALLTDCLPFRGGDPSAIDEAQLSGHLVPPNELSAEKIPHELEAIVLRALAPRREDRFSSALEFIAALDALDCVRSQTSSPAISASTERRRANHVELIEAKLGALVRRDPPFRVALLADPRSAIERKFQTRLPPDILLHVHEDSESALHFVLRTTTATATPSPPPPLPSQAK